VLRVTDEFGAIQPFANDAIRFELSGPAEIIGDNPFALVGGTGAIWIRAFEMAGKAKLDCNSSVPRRTADRIRRYRGPAGDCLRQFAA
jgi:hypothetical protein